METPAIELSHVSKTYQKHFWTKRISAVTDCSLTVEKNTVTGFVGPNGAGKTTSIKMLLGLVRPTSGTLRIFGKDPRVPSSRKGLSYLSERPYFYDHLTVQETLRFSYGLLQGFSSSGEADIRRALETVELSARSAVKVKDLSKGMQQRLSMAQALLGKADLFILDEPMSGLDPLGRRLFREILLRLGKEGKTVFFSTHILDDVESVCSHVVVLSGGRLGFQGPLATLLAQGRQNTECTVAGLGKEDRNALAAMGFAVTPQADGAEVIVVPAEKDLRQCQHYLCDKGIFCTSIVKRTASLEDIIYKKE